MMTTEKSSSESIEDAGNIAITPKSSRALKIWIALVVVVLAVLWLETRHNVGQNFNLFLSGEADTVGSEVFVDGKKVGAMVASEDSGLGGGAFWTHINDGPHLIEVRKAEFTTFSKQINMRREDYIGVNLKPKKLIEKGDPSLDALGGN
ncbi:MAG: hypothetical protein K2Y22_10460 [Candidatus Obscuribacterales bacterium]|nr:hypothetical protein [Candidatus Obscuribacterales bacterium]